MATDEEYLDNLLKSLTENKQQPVEGENNGQENTDTNALTDSEAFSDWKDGMEPAEMPSDGLTDETGVPEGDFADFSTDEGAALEQLAGLTDYMESSQEQSAEFEKELEMPEKEFGEFADLTGEQQAEEDSFAELSSEVEDFLEESTGIPGGTESFQERSESFTGGEEDFLGENISFPEEAEISEEEQFDLPDGLPEQESLPEVLEGEDFTLEQLMDMTKDSSSEQDSGIGQEKTDSAGEDYEEWKMDIDDLLAEADVSKGADAGVTNEENQSTDTGFSNMENVDITDMIDSMENTDSDLDEINSLLKKADGGQSLDDDMLALLEGIEEPGGSDSADDELDLFADMPVQKINDEPGPRSEEKKTKNKKRSSKDKKKAGKNKGDSQGVERETGIQSVFGDEDDEFQGDFGEDGLDNSWGIGEIGEDKTGEEEKKPGLWARFMDYITQEEEEEEPVVSAENAEILRELDEEDKKKGKKGGKKKKGKNGKKEEDEGDDKGESGKGKKGKKPKKEKKPKPVKEKKEKEPWENPFKLFSAKHVILLLAFCGTMVASICILSIFLPEFADKRDARTAFHDGDYETVYELLYDKKLQGNDAIMFDRAKTVLVMERKLKSYANNMALGQEMEAVDALIKGVECYSDLIDVSDYGTRTQIDNIYQQICTILENNYGISPALATELSAYDSITYTKRLYDIISGTGLGQDGESNEAEDAAAVPLDVLPEEEELLGDE